MVMLEKQFDPGSAWRRADRRRVWIAGFTATVLATALSGCAPKSDVSPAGGPSAPPAAQVQSRIAGIETQIRAVQNSPNLPQNAKDQQVAALRSEEAAMAGPNTPHNP